MPVSVSVVPSDSDVETVTFSVTVAVVVVVIVVGVVVVVVVVVVVGITWISVTFIFAFKTHLLATVSENKTELEGRDCKKVLCNSFNPTFWAPAYSYSRAFLCGKDWIGKSFAFYVVGERIKSESLAIDLAGAQVSALGGCVSI